MSDQNSSSVAGTPTPEVSRNEPCPCGSGKKYKRCHGVDAPPKLSAPKAQDPSENPFAGMDPNSLDPAWIQQFTTALQRLPKGQMNQLQVLMQKAMSGKDISKEAAMFEKNLPVELQSLVNGASGMAGLMGGAPGAGVDTGVADQLTADIDQAMASRGVGSSMPGSTDTTDPEAKKEALGKFGKFWRGLTKK